MKNLFRKNLPASAEHKSQNGCLAPLRPADQVKIFVTPHSDANSNGKLKNLSNGGTLLPNVASSDFQVETECKIEKTKTSNNKKKKEQKEKKKNKPPKSNKTIKKKSISSPVPDSFCRSPNPFNDLGKKGATMSTPLLNRIPKGNQNCQDKDIALLNGRIPNGKSDTEFRSYTPSTNIINSGPGQLEEPIKQEWLFFLEKVPIIHWVKKWACLYDDKLLIYSAPPMVSGKGVSIEDGEDNLERPTLITLTPFDSYFEPPCPPIHLVDLVRQSPDNALKIVTFTQNISLKIPAPLALENTKYKGYIDDTNSEHRDNQHPFNQRYSHKENDPSTTTIMYSFALEIEKIFQIDPSLHLKNNFKNNIQNSVEDASLKSSTNSCSDPIGPQGSLTKTSLPSKMRKKRRVDYLTMAHTKPENRSQWVQAFSNVLSYQRSLANKPPPSTLSAVNTMPSYLNTANTTANKCLDRQKSEITYPTNQEFEVKQTKVLLPNGYNSKISVEFRPRSHTQIFDKKSQATATPTTSYINYQSKNQNTYTNGHTYEDDQQLNFTKSQIDKLTNSPDKKFPSDELYSPLHDDLVLILIRNKRELKRLEGELLHLNSTNSSNGVSTDVRGNNDTCTVQQYRQHLIAAISKYRDAIDVLGDLLAAQKFKQPVAIGRKMKPKSSINQQSNLTRTTTVSNNCISLPQTTKQITTKFDPYLFKQINPRLLTTTSTIINGNSFNQYSSPNHPPTSIRYTPPARQINCPQTLSSLKNSYQKLVGDVTDLSVKDFTTFSVRFESLTNYLDSSIKSILASSAQLMTAPLANSPSSGPPSRVSANSSYNNTQSTSNFEARQVLTEFHELRAKLTALRDKVYKFFADRDELNHLSLTASPNPSHLEKGISTPKISSISNYQLLEKRRMGKGDYPDILNKINGAEITRTTTNPSRLQTRLAIFSSTHKRSPGTKNTNSADKQRSRSVPPQRKSASTAVPEVPDEFYLANPSPGAYLNQQNQQQFQSYGRTPSYTNAGHSALNWPHSEISSRPTSKVDNNNRFYFDGIQRDVHLNGPINYDYNNNCMPSPPPPNLDSDGTRLSNTKNSFRLQSNNNNNNNFNKNDPSPVVKSIIRQPTPVERNSVSLEMIDLEISKPNMILIPERLKAKDLGYTAPYVNHNGERVVNHIQQLNNKNLANGISDSTAMFRRNNYIDDSSSINFSDSNSDGHQQCKPNGIRSPNSRSESGHPNDGANKTINNRSDLEQGRKDKIKKAIKKEYLRNLLSNYNLQDEACYKNLAGGGYINGHAELGRENVYEMSGIDSKFGGFSNPATHLNGHDYPPIRNDSNRSSPSSKEYVKDLERKKLAETLKQERERRERLLSLNEMLAKEVAAKTRDLALRAERL